MGRLVLFIKVSDCSGEGFLGILEKTQSLIAIRAQDAADPIRYVVVVCMGPKKHALTDCTTPALIKNQSHSGF